MNSSKSGARSTELPPKEFYGGDALFGGTREPVGERRSLTPCLVEFRYPLFSPRPWTAGNWEETMLWTIFVVLLVLWLLGVVSSYTLGGFIHILLVVAVILLVLQLVQGRRAI